MISNYTRPQSTITQLLQRTPVPAATRRNPLVVGPEFKLVFDDGRVIPSETFLAAGASANYAYGSGTALDLAEYTVDQSSVEVTGKNLLAEVNSFTSAIFEYDADNLRDLRLSTDTLVAGTHPGKSLNAINDGRDVKVGDTFIFTSTTDSNATIFTRRVVSLLGRVEPGAVTDKGPEAGSPVGAPTTGDIDVTGTYTGTVDRRYILDFDTVTSYSVIDGAGIDPTTYNAAHTSVFPLGTDGLSVEITAGTITAGLRLYVTVTASSVSATGYSGVRLDGPVVNGVDYASAQDTVIGIGTINQPFSGVITDANVEFGGGAVSVTATKVDYAASLGLSTAAAGVATDFSPFVDSVGEVVVSYKASRIPTTLESAIKITSEAQAVELLGEDSEDNWLAHGAIKALRGNADRVVYVLRTAADTTEAFAAALAKVSKSDLYYTVAPMTDSLEVQQLVGAHVTASSTPVVRNFRRAYVGTDTPGVYDRWSTLTNGSYRQATILNSVLTIEAADRPSSVFVIRDIGATMYVASLGQSYTITDVLNEYEVELDISGAVVVSSPSAVTLTRPADAESTADFVVSRSITLSDRRLTNVWADNPVSDGFVPAKFMAAEIAGLRCALEPQQGLTRTEVESVDSVTGSYTRFSEDLLDEIAANGTMVITQDGAGAPVYIRHQLTTKAEDGAALEYEDNIGVIADEFSYAIKDLSDEYIGKKNATPLTITQIRNEIGVIADGFTKTTFAAAELGPMVLTYFNEEGVEGQVTVRQDGVLADTLLTYTKLRVPLPLNGLNHYVDVEATSVLEAIA